MESSSIPAKFPIPWAANANGSYIRAIPETSIDPTAASLSLGWPPDTFIPEASGGTPPSGKDGNGINNQITAWLQWVSAGGPISYDSVFSSAIGGYPAGAWLLAVAGNSWWVSQVDNNISDPDTGGANWLAISFGQVGSGNPNGAVAGNAPSQGSLAQSLYFDTAGSGVWICTTTGTTSTAVWAQVGSGGAGPGFYCGASTGTANAQTLATPAAMQTFVAGSLVSCKIGAGLNNTGATNFIVGSFGTFAVRKDGPTGPAALAGGELKAGNTPLFLLDGAVLHLLNPATGTAAQANASSNTGTVVAASGSFTPGDILVASDANGTAVDGGSFQGNTMASAYMLGRLL